jgi:superfamily I DNA and/or RNA helicase
MTILEERIAGLTRIEKDPARHLLYYRHCLAVGTVHALQGAEKDIVIFSPVYGRNYSYGPLFFNQSYNMLNVAVSRAKKHFFVFGNMALFKAEKFNTPVSDLGRLLFRSPDNQISNEFLFKEIQM